MLRVSIDLGQWLDERPWYRRVLAILDEYEETPETASFWACGRGGLWIRERVLAVADLCVRLFPGDLLEIGAQVGHTTRGLAEIARTHGRRVLVVDPWDTQYPNCDGWEYDVFRTSVKQYEDIVDVCRFPSFEDEAIQAIKERELAFVFVDGLHVYEAVRQDIQTASHCHGVITVDDLQTVAGVWDAFLAASEDTDRVPLWRMYYREGYLLPKGGVDDSGLGV